MPNPDRIDPAEFLTWMTANAPETLATWLRAYLAQRAPGCRYYGKSHIILQATGKLVDQLGNECALITDSYSPCQMEIDGQAPDQTRCPIALSVPPSKRP